eukprot:TRINITY_DN66502_c5_g1_i1.p1 TRINITY_DN66502_c5_g1~~TRINITY_DN66502_c5_g1_i1.p1  ORF type:complete len:345 (-),score=79.14 TRINITY_DN66502_c5_g1_i1:141-1076(-)
MMKTDWTSTSKKFDADLALKRNLGGRADYSVKRFVTQPEEKTGKGHLVLTRDLLEFVEEWMKERSALLSLQVGEDLMPADLNGNFDEDVITLKSMLEEMQTTMQRAVELQAAQKEVVKQLYSVMKTFSDADLRLPKPASNLEGDESGDEIDGIAFANPSEVTHAQTFEPMALPEVAKKRRPTVRFRIDSEVKPPGDTHLLASDDEDDETEDAAEPEEEDLDSTDEDEISHTRPNFNQVSRQFHASKQGAGALGAALVGIGRKPEEEEDDEEEETDEEEEDETDGTSSSSSSDNNDSGEETSQSEDESDGAN